MTQLETLRNLVGNDSIPDGTLEFYLDNASDIICDIRFTTAVESQYKSLQIKMALEMINKIGAEGQTSHGENGISRSYESADLSPSLLNQVTPYARTPFSVRRVIS